MPSDRPATVTVVPLEPHDLSPTAEAHARLAGQQIVGWVLATGLMLGGAHMYNRGHTTDAIACAFGAALMWWCAIGFKSARGRDRTQFTKEVIVGVLERRKVFVPDFGPARYWFTVGGVEVVVTAEVHEQFREGQSVRAERLSGSRQLLRVTPASP